MEIVDWPEVWVGRPEPTIEELNIWRTEFESRPEEKLLIDAEDV